MSVTTSLGSTWNTTAGSKTVTAVPDAGSLIIIVAASSGLAGGTTSVSDDQGGTYTQVDTDRTGFSTTGVLTVWARDSLVPATTSTIFTAAQVGSSGGGLSVLEVTSMLNVGAAAVRSAGGQSSGGSGTTPAPVLNQTPLFYNTIITAVASGTNGGGTAVRSSPLYTDVAIAGYNTPATGLDVSFLDGDETSATITWGGTIATVFASVAIELDGPPPVYASIKSTTVPNLRPRAPRSRLFPPAVVDQPGLLAPIKVVCSSISAPRKFMSFRSTLFDPAVVNEAVPPQPPDEVLPENLAPVIYGYGAM